MLTVKEACDLLRICRQTLYAMVQRGELIAIRLKGAYRIPAAEVERLLGVRS
jgi:excisionase family DNA binding protein